MGRHSSNDLQDRRALPGAVPRFTGKLLTDRRPGNRRGNISERDVSRSARDQPLSPRALIRGSMRSHAASILTNRRFPEMLEILRDPPEMEASIFRYRVTNDDSSPPLPPTHTIILSLNGGSRRRAQLSGNVDPFRIESRIKPIR